MTQPVILYGTLSNGETLPVQVDDTGRLVAEGLEQPTPTLAQVLAAGGIDQLELLPADP